jgi:small subunit ribosomal protein S20
MGYNTINNKFKIRLVDMANHKSAEKRIRQIQTRRLRNRYIAKTTRNAVRKLRAITEKAEAQKLYPTVCSMLDKLAKKNVIHKNKAGNLKSKLARRVNSL